MSNFQFQQQMWAQQEQQRRLQEQMRAQQEQQRRLMEAQRRAEEQRRHRDLAYGLYLQQQGRM